MIPDPKLLTKFPKWYVVELSSIILNKYPRDPKTTNVVLSDEAFDILLSKLCQRFRFPPFVVK